MKPRRPPASRYAVTPVLLSRAEENRLVSQLLELLADESLPWDVNHNAVTLLSKTDWVIKYHHQRFTYLSVELIEPHYITFRWRNRRKLWKAIQVLRNHWIAEERWKVVTAHRAALVELKEELEYTPGELK